MPSAVPPRIKNGTSLPSLAAKPRSFFCDNFKFQSLLSPLRTAAASEEAPPSPEETGMFFLMDMWANFWRIFSFGLFFNVFLKSWRARKARFLDGFFRIWMFFLFKLFAWVVDFSFENLVL